MTYVSGGQMLDSRSPWRLSIFTDVFWGIVNFVVLFFSTLVQPSKGKSDYSSNGSGRRGDGPDFPRRRMGGFNNRGGGPSPPPMGGGG